MLTCKLSSSDVRPTLSADKLSAKDCEPETGVLTGLFFWSSLSLSLPEHFDPSQLLPLNVCFNPPNKFRLGFGELREDADDDLLPYFELSVAEHGPDDDFGNRDICFLPVDGVDALLDLPCDLLSIGKLEISGAELQHIANSCIVTSINLTNMLWKMWIAVCSCKKCKSMSTYSSFDSSFWYEIGDCNAVNNNEHASVYDKYRQAKTNS